MIAVIVALNIIVFFLWSFFSPEFMIDNFLVSWQSLEEGRVWTLFTAIFSHNLFIHIFLNMYVLSSFGPVVLQAIGRWRFLKFYLLAGLVSSLSHALVSSFLLNEPGIPALGASGAISGVILFFSLLFPREKIYLLGLIPLPALFGSLAFIGLDLWGLVAQTQGGGLPIGHGAHLGGALTGVIYYFIQRKPKLRGF